MELPKILLRVRKGALIEDNKSSNKKKTRPLFCPMSVLTILYADCATHRDEGCLGRDLGSNSSSDTEPRDPAQAR